MERKTAGDNANDIKILYSKFFISDKERRENDVTILFKGDNYNYTHCIVWIKDAKKREVVYNLLNDREEENWGTAENFWEEHIFSGMLHQSNSSVLTNAEIIEAVSSALNEPAESFLQRMCKIFFAERKKTTTFTLKGSVGT